VLLENLIAYSGKAVMYTLTPPGARRRWNASCQRRLSRLYETVQQSVYREVGVRANLLAVGKEAQLRGAVHVHYVLGVQTAVELRAARAFRRYISEPRGTG